jgi:Zinc-finger associated domain (zf-AD)
MDADKIISIDFMGKTMLFDSTNFCRCCLAADESLVPMANPGSNQANGSTLQTLYDLVCPLTIQFDGKLKICESCVFDLRMAFEFRQMCVQANAKLEEIVQTRKRKKSNSTAVVEEALPNNYIKMETNTFEPVKVKEEPVEQELLNADSQIEAMTEVRAEVKIEEELTIMDHMTSQNNDTIETTEIKTEKEMGTNGFLDEANTELVPDADTSLAHHSGFSHNLRKDGMTLLQVQNNGIITEPTNIKTESPKINDLPHEANTDRAEPETSLVHQSEVSPHLRKDGMTLLQVEFTLNIDLISFLIGYYQYFYADPPETRRNSGYDCCNCTHKTNRELRLHRFRHHKKHLLFTFIKYHNNFFPKCDFKANLGKVKSNFTGKLDFFRFWEKVK